MKTSAVTQEQLLFPKFKRLIVAPNGQIYKFDSKITGYLINDYLMAQNALGLGALNLTEVGDSRPETFI